MRSAMKLLRNLFKPFVILLLTLTSCASPSEHLEVEYSKLLHPDATLLYEHADTSSSATGACAGPFVDGWYGSQIGDEELLQKYEDQLLVNGWSYWSEGQTWRKEVEGGLFSGGLFSLYIRVLPTGKPIDAGQGHYTLPDSVIQEAIRYETVYFIHIKYMTNYAVKNCFER
jgi:hypothetical protein